MEMSGLNDQALEIGYNWKRSISSELKNLLVQRFVDFGEAVYESMKWVDPINWLPNLDYGIEEIEVLSKHFEEPLQESGFDKAKVLIEWKCFKKFVNAKFRDVPARVLWEKIFSFKA